MALGFAEATRFLPRTGTGLGILQAASSGEPAVSRVDRLPPDSGSGLWLRRFGATRSVAVPILDGSGLVVHVVALALPQDTPEDGSVTEAIRVRVAGWKSGG
ncbi:MAG: hypothetical protein NVSMB9_31400 [Isosphaeraceae bacterium]